MISGVFCHKTPQAKHLSGVTHCEQSPELGDLLLCVEQIVGKKQRSSSALLLQAKMGQKVGGTGQFGVGTGSEAVQRYLYANWPSFSLTGLPGSSPQFDIAPPVAGQCPGSRYACIESSPAPNESGWWIEERQATAVTPYSGTFPAAVGLGEALTRMVNGSLGAPLEDCVNLTNLEWKRLVGHLLNVAVRRDARDKNPPDVSGVSGYKPPHHAVACLMKWQGQEFLAEDPFEFLLQKRTPWKLFRSLLEDGMYYPWPPYWQPPTSELVLDKDQRGLGIIRVTLIDPEWSEEADRPKEL